MNILEKQTELGKSLYQINTSAMKELATLQAESLDKYFETNRAFGERVTEIKDIQTAYGLQKEYNETIWTNSKESFEAQLEVIKAAFEEVRDCMKGAFTMEEEAKPKAKAKAKPRAKKAPAAEAA